MDGELGRTGARADSRAPGCQAPGPDTRAGTGAGNRRLIIGPAISDVTAAMKTMATKIRASMSPFARPTPARMIPVKGAGDPRRLRRFTAAHL